MPKDIYIIMRLYYDIIRFLIPQNEPKQGQWTITHFRIEIDNT